LLRLVAGLEYADGGSVLIGGRDVSGVPPRKRGIALVFQSYAIFPHMTVRRNISFGLRMRHEPEQDIQRRVTRAAEVVRALGRVRPIGNSQQPLRIASEVVSIGNRWNPQERISVGLSAGIIADRICFLALPGEPFVEHQITFREKSECPVALLFGYAVI